MRQDVRGRYDSEDEFYIYVNEGKDGYDAVEWVAGQPWCNGDVGTYGRSYMAATQNASAVYSPPHLKTMFVIVGTSNYIEDGAGRGGAFALLHNLAYAFRLAFTGKEARKDAKVAAALRRAYDLLPDWLRAAPLKSGSPLQWTPTYERWYAVSLDDLLAAHPPAPGIPACTHPARSEPQREVVAPNVVRSLRP